MKPCESCGTSTVREVPADLGEPWRSRLLRMPTYCDACTAAAEEDRLREEAEAEARDHERRVERRQAASGIPARWRAVTWSAPLAAHSPPLTAARRWAAGEGLGLLLAGPVGVGKTHMAAAAAWGRLELGPLRWLSVPVLFAHLALSFDNPLHEAAVEALAGTTALVLDDLDKARPTDYAAEQLLTGIESRYQAEAPLLVTTNLSLDQLAARYPTTGDAIASRLVEHCEAFVLEGSDRRLELRQRSAA